MGDLEKGLQLLETSHSLIGTASGARAQTTLSVPSSQLTMEIKVCFEVGVQAGAVRVA